jgi:hypothetical protein
MRIEPAGRPPATNGPGTAKPSSGFAALLDAAAQAEAVLRNAPAAPPQALSASLEDVASHRTADRQARRHGRAMLQALADLQRAILAQAPAGGEADAVLAVLITLAGLASSTPEAHDPVLRLIMREIGVRAATELARRAAAPDGARA